MRWFSGGGSKRAEKGLIIVSLLASPRHSHLWRSFLLGALCWPTEASKWKLCLHLRAQPFFYNQVQKSATNSSTWTGETLLLEDMLVTWEVIPASMSVPHHEQRPLWCRQHKECSQTPALVLRLSSQWSCQGWQRVVLARARCQSKFKMLLLGYENVGW